MSCDHTHSQANAAPPLSPVHRLLDTGFQNALTLCLGELRAEPKTMLILGGCRQLRLAQQMALLLPYTQITLLDSEDAHRDNAKNTLGCRLQFLSANPAHLPFQDNAFDVTLAHHLFQCIDPATVADNTWPAILSELIRVTGQDVIFSLYRPVLGKLLHTLPGIRHALIADGFDPKALAHHPQPKASLVLYELQRYGKFNPLTRPFPWTLGRLALEKSPATQALHEKRLVLQ